MNMSVDKTKALTGIQISTTARAILYMIVGCSCFSISDVILKFMTGSMPPIALAFWGDIGAVTAAILLSKPLGGLKQTLQSKHKLFHLIRGTSLTCGYILFLFSLPHMPLANSYTLTFLWPLIATFMAIVLLKEHAHIHHWICLLIGLAGITIILKPGFGDYNAALLYPLAAAFFFAFAMVSARKLPESETHLSFALYPILVTLLITGAYMAFNFEAPANLQSGLILGAVGFLNVFGCIYVGRAFSTGAMASVSPFEYTKMVWAVVLGYVIFGDLLDLSTAIGAALIIASGIYLMVHDNRRTKNLKRIAVPEQPLG